LDLACLLKKQNATKEDTVGKQALIWFLKLPLDEAGLPKTLGNTAIHFIKKGISVRNKILAHKRPRKKGRIIKHPPGFTATNGPTNNSNQLAKKKNTTQSTAQQPFHCVSLKPDLRETPTP